MSNLFIEEYGDDDQLNMFKYEHTISISIKDNKLYFKYDDAGKTFVEVSNMKELKDSIIEKDAAITKSGDDFAKIIAIVLGCIFMIPVGIVIKLALQLD